MPDYRYTSNVSTPKCGSCVYVIEHLDLTDFGFPGLSFSGDLAIEPDDTLNNEDWYIQEVYATNPGRINYITFRYNSLNPFHRDLYQAIVKAVAADEDLRDRITDASRENA